MHNDADPNPTPERKADKKVVSSLNSKKSAVISVVEDDSYEKQTKVC